MTRFEVALCLHSVAATAVWIAHGDALAAELANEPKTSPSQESSSQRPFDVGFGIAFTSDYISRGITNSDGRPAVQGYIEPTFGLAYVNVWSSNVDFGEGFRGAEIDVSGGVKRWDTEDQFWYDFGYIHYFYSPDDTSPDYGEVFSKIKYDFGDFALGGEVDFAPDYNQSGKTATYVESYGEIKLKYDFKLIGGIGYQFSNDPDTFEYLTWNAGLKYTWNDKVTLDVRYYDSDLSEDECVFNSGFADGCGARIVGSISFDTTWRTSFGH